MGEEGGKKQEEAERVEKRNRKELKRGSGKKKQMGENGKERESGKKQEARREQEREKNAPLLRPPCDRSAAPTASAVTVTSLAAVASAQEDERGQKEGSQSLKTGASLTLLFFSLCLSQHRPRPLDFKKKQKKSATSSSAGPPSRPSPGSSAGASTLAPRSSTSTTGRPAPRRCSTGTCMRLQGRARRSRVVSPRPRWCSRSTTLTRAASAARTSSPRRAWTAPPSPRSTRRWTRGRSGTIRRGAKRKGGVFFVFCFRFFFSSLKYPHPPFFSFSFLLLSRPKKKTKIELKQAEFVKGAKREETKKWRGGRAVDSALLLLLLPAAALCAAATGVFFFVFRSVFRSKHSTSSFLFSLPLPKQKNNNLEQNLSGRPRLFQRRHDCVPFLLCRGSQRRRRRVAPR